MAGPRLSGPPGMAAPDNLRADAQAAAGGLAYWRGDIGETSRRYESALALRRDIGEDIGVADALYDLAFVYQPEYWPPPVDPERTARAAALVGEAQDVYRRSGNEAGLAKTGWMMGNLLLQQDSPEAKAVLGASVERFRKVDDPFGLGWALYSYGLALLGCSDAASAGQAFREALELSAAAGDGSALGLLLEAFGEVAIAEGDALRATRLRGAAAGNGQATEADIAFVDPPWSKDNSTRMTDAAALEAAWSEGRAMSQAEAIAYALTRDREAEPEGTLRVSALGSTLVERAGRPVTKWGGPKAGSRQAQAMFAFLLDRGEHGVTKDEFIDVIWPDAELEQGDLNFHRTLGGLRATLQSDKADAPIVFANGRYRMKPRSWTGRTWPNSNSGCRMQPKRRTTSPRSMAWSLRGICIEAIISRTVRCTVTASTSRSDGECFAAGWWTRSSILAGGTRREATARLPRRGSERR